MSKTLRKEQSPIATFFKLWKFMLSQKTWVLTALLISVVLYSLLGPLTIYLGGYIVDAVVRFYESASWVTLLGVKIAYPLFFVLLLGLVLLIQELLLALIMYLYRTLDIFLNSGKAEQYIIEKFYSFNLADLESLDIYTNIEVFTRFWASNAYWAIRNTFRIIGGLVSLAFILIIFAKEADTLVIGPLILVIIGVIGSGIISGYSKRVLYKVNVSMSNLRRWLVYIRQTTLSITTFMEQKVNGIYRLFLGELERAGQKFVQIKTTLLNYKTLSELISLLVRLYGYIGGRVLYAYTAILNRVSVGTIVANFGLLGNFYTTSNQLFTYTSDLLENLLYVGSFFHILELNSPYFSVHGRVEVPAKQPILIEWRNLTYKLPKSNKVLLKDTNWVIEPFQKVFVYGQDGVGKTFLAKILTTLFPVPRGTYFINGVDVVDIKRGNVKALFSVVTDNFGTYSLPLYENITLQEDPDQIDKEKYELALYIAQLDQWARQNRLMWSNKPLGATFGDMPLSRGYWQRIAIARAVYRDAPIFLFDMPFTYVDDHGKTTIMERVLRYVSSEKKTLIYITEEFDFWKYFDAWYQKTPTQIKPIKRMGLFAKT